MSAVSKRQEINLEAEKRRESILRFLSRNPGSSQQQIAEALNEPARPVRYQLTMLEKQGRIRSKTVVNRTGLNAPRKLYYSEAGCVPELLERARRFGAPFGILIAQITD